jgi:hypothetical protein
MDSTSIRRGGSRSVNLRGLGDLKGRVQPLLFFLTAKVLG